MKATIIISLVLTAFLIGCYEDKGNYNYKQVNNIEIEFPDYNFMQVIGDTFRLNPILKYKNSDTLDMRLAYEWTIGDRVIGTNRKLEWKVDTNKQVYISLRVTNLTDEMVYMNRMAIRPTSIYTAYRSYLVLSEKNGKSMLSFVQYDEKTDENGEYLEDEYGRPILNNKVIKDIYYRENQEELGGKPLFIQEHIAKVFPSEGHVVVFQEGGLGSVDLDGITMKKDILLEESFVGGTYPEDFYPVNAEMMTYTHLIENHDGKIYSKIKDTYKLFQSGYYIHTPLFFENREVHGHIINTCQPHTKPFSLVHSFGTRENPENRLLVIHDLQNEFSNVNVSAKVVALPEPVNGWPEGFVPLTDLGDYEVINISHHKASSSDQEPGYTMFLKASDGSYLYQNFGFKREYSVEKFAYLEKKIGGEKKEMLISQPLNSPVPLEDCIFCNMSSYRSSYTFVAYGRDIYFLDRDTPENGLRHFYTCKADVVAMDGRESSGSLLFVGLGNGSVLLLNAENAKNLVLDAEKFRWESDESVDLGKIVDVTLKVGGQVP